MPACWYWLVPSKLIFAVAVQGPSGASRMTRFRPRCCGRRRGRPARRGCAVRRRPRSAPGSGARRSRRCRASVPSKLSTMVSVSAAAAAATAARRVRVEADPVEVRDRVGSSPGRTARPGRPAGPPSRRCPRRGRRGRTATPSYEYSARSVEPSRDQLDPVGQRSVGRDAAELVGRLVARVAAVLVDELEVTAGARVDHVDRGPVVVVLVDAQTGLLVVHRSAGRW